jgi:sugar lactone lactonase YvrE
VQKLDVQHAPSLSFAGTAAGSSSAPQVITLGNNGNLPLTLSTLTETSAGLGAGTTCDTSTAIAAGTACSLAIDFIPAAQGSQTGSVSITDNTLYDSPNLTQTIQLSGVGLGSGSAAQTISFPAPVSPVEYGVAPISLAATASSGLAVSYAITGPATVSGSTLTITGAGTVTIIASQDGDATYGAAASVTQSIFVSSGPILNVGTTSGTLTATMSFSSTGTLNSTLLTAIQVLTQGATGLDFNYVSGGTCVPGMSYTPSQTCTVDYTFTPTRPWMRYGGIQLLNSAGLVVSNTYISGMGDSAQTTFALSTPTAPTSLGSGFIRPWGMAVDSSGNVYVGDAGTYVSNTGPGTGSVYEILAAGGYTTIKTLGGVYAYPDGLAVDGIGNVYVTDSGNSTVREIPLGCVSSSCVVGLGGDWRQPLGIAVDQSGNVYVADLAATVVEMPPNCFSTGCMTILGGGFAVPFGVAVDAGGNVYVADHYNNAVSAMAAGCVSASCVVPLGGGFNSPDGIAVDGSGNVYVTEHNDVAKMPPGCFTAGCVTTLGSGFVYPLGVAVDGSGNVFFADSGTATVDKIDIQDPPSLSFANTFLGSSSTQQVVTLGNNGNLPLTISALTGTNASFAGAATTCNTSAAVAGGSACLLGIEFAPSAAGALTGSAVITDNNLNISPSASQTIHLTGTASAETPVLTLASVATVAYGSNSTFSASLTWTGNGAAPTGAVSFTVDSGSPLPAICTGNSTPVTCTYSASFALGSHTLNASFAGDADYASTSATAVTFSVGQQTPTLTLGSVTTVSQGGSSALDVSLAWTGSGSVPTGAVTLSVDGSTALAAICTGTASPMTCTYSGSYGVGSHTLNASYAGDTNYVAATAIQGGFSVNQQTPTLTLGSVTTVSYGGSSALSVSLAWTGSGSAPTGAVTFSIDSGTALTASCTGTTSPIICTSSGSYGAGSHTLNASYAGDTNYAAATATQDSFSVSKQAPTLTLASVTTVSYGGSSAFSTSLTWTGSGSVPTGAAIFSVDGGTALTAICTGTTSPITCTSSGSYGAGSHTLNASYAGDTNYGAATATQGSFSVSKQSPALTLASVTTVSYGSSSALSASVIWTGSGAVPTGAVSFSVDGGAALTAVCSVTTSPITCTYSGSYSVGTHTLNASYGGDANYGAATATQGSFSVSKQTPTLTLASVTTVTYGGSSALSVSLAWTGSGSVPTGAVTFGVDSGTALTAICTGATSPITCTFSGSYAGGSHTLNASYAGDANYGAATATQANFSVGKQSPSLTLSAVTTVSYPTPSALSVSVAWIGGGSAPTGAVTFSVSSGPALAASCAGTTSPIVCTYSGSFPAGSHTLNASLAADTNYSAASAAQTSFSVSQQSPTLTLGSVATVTFPANSTLSATLAWTGAGSAPTGAVTFNVDGGSTLSASCSGTTSPLVCTYSGSFPSGSHTLIASYAFDTNYSATASTTGSFTVLVAPAKLVFGTLPATPLTAGGNGGSAITVLEESSSSAVVTTATDPITLTVTGPAGFTTRIYGPTAAVAGVATFNVSGAALTVPGTYTYTASSGSLTNAVASEIVNPAVSANTAVPSWMLTVNKASGAFTPVTGSGGTGALSYSVSPALPAGLNYSTSTGTITGTATATSVATTYTVTVTDTNLATATATFSLTVNSAVLATQAVASTSLTVNKAAAPFTPVTGSGGTGTLSFSVSPSLPAGLNYSTSAGIITGTPTATSAATTYTVTVTDANGATATATFSLTVNFGVVATQAIASTTLTVNQLAIPLTPVTGAGGTGTLSYGVLPILPPGLSYSTSTGSITGTPTATSSPIVYTVTVTDANGATAAATFSLAVSSAAPTVSSVTAVTSQYGSIAGVTVTAGESGAFGLPTGGVVTFSVVSPATGSFSPATCTLASAGACTTTYTPTGTLPTGTYTNDISASFAAVGSYAAASGNSTLSITAVASTTASVSPVTAAYGSTTDITVTAMESGTAGATTGGVVTFGTAGGVGGSFAPITCTLTSAGTCTTTYTPSGSLAVGTYTGDITASFAANNNYSAASGSSTLSITPNGATISNVSGVSVAYGSTIGIAVTATESGSAGSVTGGVVSFSVLSPATGSFSPATCTLNAAGTCTTTYTPTGTLAVGTYINDISASFMAVGNYAAATGTSTLTISSATQAIIFTPPTSPVLFGAPPISLSATGGASGNPVTFSVLSGPGSISGSTLTITGVGTVVVAANQAAGGNYSAAPQVTQSVVVNSASQSIVFTPLTSPVIFGVPPITLSATGGASGNPVTFSVVSGPGSISGSTLTITGVGTVVVAANQAAAGNYSAAPQVTQSVVVNSASQSIVFTPLTSPVVFGVPPMSLSATGGASGNPVTFSVVSGPGSISGSTLTITGVGTVVVAANQAAGGNYSAAPQVTQSVVVTSATQAITFTPPTPVTYGVAPITLSATGGASSDPVTFTFVSGPGNLSGNVLSITGAGTLAITANQAAGNGYSAAAPVTAIIVVNKATPTATIISSLNPVLVQNAITFTATVSSTVSVPTGSVSFYDNTSGVALGSANLIGGVATYSTSTLAGGTHSVTAIYSGDSNFVSVTSAGVVQSVLDFSLDTSNSNVTIGPGGTATFVFTASPIGSTTFPAGVGFSVNGLPVLATYTLTPNNIAAGAGATQFVLAITVPQQTVQLEDGKPMGKGLASVALALLVLPFAGRVRKRAKGLRRLVLIALLILVGAGASVGLSGCGTTTGFFGTVQQSYAVTVTGTSGTLSHSKAVTLTVE